MQEKQIPVSLVEGWAKGGEGGADLAEKVVKTIETKPSNFKFLYDTNLSIKEKISTIATEIYGADKVNFTSDVEKTIKQLNEMGYDKLPICMAKTQYSFSDDQTKLGRPTGFDITIREIRLSAGAGFLVCITGAIMTMPGLPKVPSACKIDIDEDGVITGLF